MVVPVLIVDMSAACVEPLINSYFDAFQNASFLRFLLGHLRIPWCTQYGPLNVETLANFTDSRSYYANAGRFENEISS